ncbi:MAG: hypothetical protein WCJ19_03505 [bacterium]
MTTKNVIALSGISLEYFITQGMNTPREWNLFCFHILTLYIRRDVRQDREVRFFAGMTNLREETRCAYSPILSFERRGAEQSEAVRSVLGFAPPLDPFLGKEGKNSDSHPFFYFPTRSLSFPKRR